MLTDKQTLILTGIMVGGIFVFGILEMLQNFIVLTVLTIIFFTVLINIVYQKPTSNKELHK